jgi:hypothetical protein
MKIVKKIVKKILTEKPPAFQLYKLTSFSQEGEDLILDRIYNGKSNGFYVDIGAHHPFRFSNTFLFYQRGWKGINVDANPGSKTLFDQFRPNDINLEIGISSNESVLDYYNFKEGALNTFSGELANQYLKGGWELKEIIKIKTCSLKQILEENIPQNQPIDFMSMDIEGFELAALTSNDWDKFRPKLLLVEILDFELETFAQNEIYKFLKSQGYKLSAKTKNTVFFEDNKSI